MKTYVDDFTYMNPIPKGTGNYTVLSAMLSEMMKSEWEHFCIGEIVPRGYLFHANNDPSLDNKRSTLQRLTSVIGSQCGRQTLPTMFSGLKIKCLQKFYMNGINFDIQIWKTFKCFS